jgi:pimeloyl-ACP methyl ester carboxylesterase
MPLSGQVRIFILFLDACPQPCVMDACLIDSCAGSRRHTSQTASASVLAWSSARIDRQCIVSPTRNMDKGSVMQTTGRLDRGDGIGLAWSKLDGASPTIVFLPGFRSDMTGDKATALAAFCAARGQAMLRFDYSGHGASDGRFEDGTIGTWARDAVTAIDRLTEGRLILIGSSMGGWLALLTTLRRPERIAAIVGIAAAPDFTERLMWEAMTYEERAQLVRDDILHIPSQYGEPTPITRALIEEGRTHLLLESAIPIDCPVRLLHGQADPDVPWEMSLRIAERVTSSDVEVSLIKDGDHRLSRPRDLVLLKRTIAALLPPDGGEAFAEAGI